MIWLTLDPHHRKDDHVGGLGLRIHVSAAA
jgi:hypothetical protein